MRRRLSDRLSWYLLCGFLALPVVSCSGSESSQISETTGPDSHDRRDLGGADELWFPDLDGDGEADMMILAEQEVYFAVARNGGYLDVIDEDGNEITVEVSDDVTVVCGSEGAQVQTLERETETGPVVPLRSFNLEIDGSTGRLYPTPSFFFDPDLLDLPAPGHGCPTSR